MIENKGKTNVRTFEIDSAFDVVTRLLPRAGIECLLIGGHAVNHYGYARATQDVDFMIATHDAGPVRKIMTEAGFTNVAVHDQVLFFNQPGSILRVDFLQTDRKTMRTLLEHAVEIEYFENFRVKVPQLKDLIAMKLFALKSGGPKRRDRDFPDIVNLAIEHCLEPEADLKPLCDAFGTAMIYRELCARIRELKNA